MAARWSGILLEITKILLEKEMQEELESRGQQCVYIVW